MNTIRITVATVLMCMSLISRAEAQDVAWGLRGGVVFASLAVDGPERFATSGDPGAMVGAFMRVELTDRIRLQPEVYWSVRRFAASGVSVPFTVTSRGIELPILVQAHLPPARATQWLLFAGPQLSFIGSVDQRVGTTTTNIDDFVRRQDIGIVAGAGFERAVSSGAMLVDVRAVFGVRDLAAVGANSQKSRAMQILMGYRF